MSQNETENNDNVIKMPVQNMKKALYKEHIAAKRNAVFGSAIVFLGLFGFINHIVWNSSDEAVSGRGIASTGSGISRTYDAEFEKEMIQLLQDSKEVRFARNPDSLEQFQYGELAGKYRVKMRQGKLKSIELSNAISKVNAEYKKSPLDFLFSQSGRLAVNYNRVDKLDSSKEDGASFETYSLKLGGEEVGKAFFEHNEAGAMVSFRVENN
ncbi:MAG: hypothetical protein VX642_10515 [Bdellovibrionota bacterium]|nr:hypothetical protein [Bdellovibrionota bacterium]